MIGLRSLPFNRSAPNLGRRAEPLHWLSPKEVTVEDFLDIARLDPNVHHAIGVDEDGRTEFAWLEAARARYRYPAEGLAFLHEAGKLLEQRLGAACGA
jgi:hypothetical protein